MMMDRVLPVVIVLAATAAWIPWARQERMREPTGGGQMPVPSADLPGECLAGAQADGRKPMMVGTMVKDPDVAFICGMIPHHQAALDMAQVVLKSGDDPEARTFAERVIRDRGRESAEMKDWLKKHAETAGRR
ncbi:DUF305 domain-containing protein [Microvirga aerophila]|uniref:DUF305 domain-containing protein n=1 Tax=Microvirga aerophila TaxID=670291 RepID=A0A512BP06_9HYPH|nr:DUF305 domain-containing protein [Microvirga aerophila]GEO13698.1 hypothetical protein MAE02_13940 [Microvirga aerophila]